MMAKRVGLTASHNSGPGADAPENSVTGDEPSAEQPKSEDTSSGQTSAAMSVAHRLEVVETKWTKFIPEERRDEFRNDLHAVSREHTRITDTISKIFGRLPVDQLTGMPNRADFQEGMLKLLKTPDSIGLLFIDLDKMKGINDEHGHLIGDAAMRYLADTIRRSVGGIACRYGGDEFLVALELGSRDQIKAIALRLKQAIDDSSRQRRELEGALGALKKPLTASIGGIGFNHTGGGGNIEQIKSLIKAADKLMYKAKADGRIHLQFGWLSDRFESETEIIAP